MIFVLVASQTLMLTPLVVLAMVKMKTSPQQGLWHLVAFAILLVVILWRYVRLRRRREIVEQELLSIHSCSIVWQAVVLAHYRAVSGSSKYPYFGYTEALAREAVSLSKVPLAIHQWIDDPSAA